MSYHLVHDLAHAAYPLAVLHEVGRDLRIELWFDQFGDESPIGGKVKIAAVPLAWQPHDGTPYGRAVLTRLVEKINACVPGERNECLVRAAYLAGGYVASGELDRDATVDALMAAARGCELPFREAEDVIARAILHGMQKPLYPPRR